MSAFPDRPDHFVQWLNKGFPQLVQQTEFVPRRLFGQYVGEQLDKVVAETSLNLRWIDEEATLICQNELDNITVRLISGGDLKAKYVILATGNFPPTDPLPLQKIGKPDCARYAWSDTALRGLPDSGSVLLLGSGLTAIDQILALDVSSFRGNIFMLSRRGLLPCKHKHVPSWSPDWTQTLPHTARGLLSEVRREVKRAISNNNDWRAVIDSLRPHAERIWEALSVKERQRFLRHLRPYWEVHRHRYPPQVQRILNKLRAQNRLCIIAGRILDCRDVTNGIEIRYRERNPGKEKRLRVDRIVNCSGHDANLRKFQDPLTRSLFLHGLARPNALSLGLDVTKDGALLGATGIPSENLFAVGPLRKGCLWETTGVPEIRVQVETLARHIAAQLGVKLPSEPV
jgi:uncharacterized NAD(P)/FAD-binding protein YdhS